MSGQHCENYDLKRETVRCYPRNVDRCCTQSERAFEGGLKPRPNDLNISTQHIPTLVAQHLQAPVKRSQHLNAAYRSIVGRNMLHAFDHPVATSCYMLCVVGSSLKMVKLEPTTHSTCRNTVAKRAQHVAPNSTML